MAIRCKQCGAAAFGFPSCPICGNELRPGAWSRDPFQPRRKRPALVGALILLLVVVGIGVLVQVRGSDEIAPAAADARTSSPTATTSPSASQSAGPTKQPAGPPRRCWDGSRVTGDKTCPVPRGVGGLAAASPAFSGARQSGQCRRLPTSLDAAGYICSVRGAQLRFAWFRTPSQLDSRFERTFASCRTVSYLRVCRGAGGSAIRYADPRFVLEVAAQPADRAVLLRLPFNPSIPMMGGTRAG